MLTLPGKVLDISALNSQHKFRDRGKKQGAVEAIEHLEEAGLGIIHKEWATRGTAMVSVINILVCNLWDAIEKKLLHHTVMRIHCNSIQRHNTPTVFVAADQTSQFTYIHVGKMYIDKL